MKAEKQIVNVNVKQKLSFGSSRSISKNISLLILCVPVIVKVFIFSYLPMVGIILAFKEFRYDMGIFKSPWSGFNNFKFFFISSDAGVIFVNTIGYNIVFILLGLVIPVTIALMLYEIRNKFALKYYQTTMFFPHFLSWVIVAYMAYSFLNPRLGILNSILSSLGLETVDFYSTPKAWRLILPILNTWKHVGYSVLFYYAALMGIDQSYFEAAEIDGASKLKQIWHISLPSISPLIIMMTILALGRIIKADFGLFYQVPMNSPLLFSTTNVIDTYIYRALMNMNEIGMPAAIGLFQSIIGFFMVIITNGVIRKIQPESSLF